MRLRHIPGAEQMIEENPHVVHEAKEKREPGSRFLEMTIRSVSRWEWEKVSLFWSRRPATRM